jgi:hypothetical protein
MRTIALLIALSGLSGCSWLCGDVVPKHTVREIKVQTDTIFEEYVKLVDQSDLHVISKDAAKTQVTKAAELITEAAK